MSLKASKTEVKANFGELDKPTDIRNIDPQFIIKTVESKLKEMKGEEDGTTRSV